MVVIGAKGMAIELVEVLSVELNLKDDALVFFDNISTDIQNRLFNRFKILRNFEEVKQHFSDYNNSFSLGLGNPAIRQDMAAKFIELGGELKSVVSAKAHIGSFNTRIGKGSTIMHGVIVTNNVSIGKGVLINLNSTISHDSTVGDFTEIASGVVIPGRCKIGERVFIGSNATLNPDISIGDNAIIGAGAVVIKDVEHNTVVVGNPAKVIKRNG
tara:strand:+ start:83453 stop:84094 length:642 start_codon:yes stop_codon:yes gene_type:complete